MELEGCLDFGCKLGEPSEPGAPEKELFREDGDDSDDKNEGEGKAGWDQSFGHEAAEPATELDYVEKSYEGHDDQV